MNSSNIILVIVIIVIIYFFIKATNKPIQRDIIEEHFNNPADIIKPKYKNKIKRKIKEENDEVIDDVMTWKSSMESADVINSRAELNPNLLDVQFHNDYRDVATALQNIVPDKRQRFNLANMPLVYSECEISEVANLCKDFIEMLNVNLKTDVPSFRGPNSGWSELIPDPTYPGGSGWDKAQESLGLAPSLYDQPAPKSPVKLITVNLVQRYETDDEIKYVIDMVIQKHNVEDQMIIKVSMVQDKRPLNDENNFFVTANIDMKVFIEEIYVTGYLSKYGVNAKLQFDGNKEKFYDYNTLEYNNVLDPKYVQKVLMEKYKERTEEMDYHNALLDEEGQAFHRTLPTIYDFRNLRETRSIFDDMNMKKQFW